MSAPIDAPDWRSLSQDDRDAGFNNSLAVKDSPAILAGWELQSAEARASYPQHLDLRYGPRERNRIDFLNAGGNGPTLGLHSWRLLAGARERDFHLLRRGSDGARHQRRLRAATRWRPMRRLTKLSAKSAPASISSATELTCARRRSGPHHRFGLVGRRTSVVHDARASAHQGRAT